MKPISICPKLSAYTAVVRKSILSTLLILFANLVFAQPTITSFSPVSGPPGTVVTITGTGFNTTASSNIVFFGPVKGTVTAATATSLTVTVPANAGYQPFSVTSNNLTAYSAKPFTVAQSGMYPLDAYALSDSKGGAFITWNDSKNAIAPIDLDADGKPEIVATQEWNNSMNLFRNTSGSTYISFSTTTPYDMGNWAKDIIGGDLNGDGIPEVVVAKAYSDGLSIYDNSLSNIYSTGINYGPSSLAITDLDGDGKSDIVAGCERSSNLVILRNTSTGGTLSFSKQSINLTGSMKKLVVRDMDGDGKPDICGILPESNLLGILLNTYTTGSLTFASSTFPINANAVQIQVSDMDGDDKPDIAISSGTGKTLSIFRNTSSVNNISLDAKIDYPTNGTPTGLAIGDIDGDTKPEIAVGDANNSIVQVFKNNSTSGTIDLTSINFTTYITASSIIINDFNGDGKNDIAFGSITANAIQILRNIIGEPEITSFTPTEGNSTTTVTIAGRNFNNATNVSFGGYAAASFVVNSSTSITAIPATTGGDGSVSVTTPLGSASLYGFNFITPPTITSFTPTYGVKGGMVTINGTNFIGLPEVTIGGIKATVQSINIPRTSMQVTIGAGATGDVVVKTSDGTASKAGFTFYDKPTITSFMPASAHYGDTITITGTNFNDLQNVTLGGYTTLYRKAESNTLIKVVAGTGATGDVLVRTPGGTVTVPGFTWLPAAPVITSFTPTSGVSGTVITITGNNFTGVTHVTFGGVTAQYTVVDANTITATLTTGASGDISVTGPGGTGTLPGFTFIYPVPTITAIAPTSAMEGETVTITGTNLSNTSAVSFGGTAATSFTVVSPTEIKAVVATGSTGNVSVTTPVGTAIIPGFTYVLPQPTITGIVPTSAGKGDLVTITGTNFTNTSMVSLGGTAVASFIVVSPTIITAIVGDGSSGNASVTTPGGTATIGGFTWLQPPVVIDEPEEEPLPTELIIYPNPTEVRTLFWVKHPAFPNGTWLRVVDMMGRVVTTVRVPAGAHLTPVYTPMLKSGYYKVGMHGALLYKYKTLMVK